MQPQGCSTPNETEEGNPANQMIDEADPMTETVVDDPADRIPPWAFSFSNVQGNSFIQQANSG